MTAPQRIEPKSRDIVAGTADGGLRVDFLLGQHRVEVRLVAPDALELWLDGCMRKRRSGSGPLYVWTNVELPFEDHHLIEARLVRSPEPRLRVSENGATLLETDAVPPGP